MNRSRNLIAGILTVIGLAVISLIIGMFGYLDYMESFRIVFGSVYVLFFPGFILTFLFFPRTREFNSKNEKGAIDWIERIALSFALSIAVVPLVIFYLNLAGLKINLVNSFFIILGIIILSLIAVYFKMIGRKHRALV